MKKAYIVQGIGESTGCRFLSSVILKCGIYGSADHIQEFQEFMYDDDKFKEQIDYKQLNTLLVRQSYPHGSVCPSLFEQYYRLKKSGFNDIYILLTSRLQTSQIMSIMYNKHLENNPINDFLIEPINRIKTAYLHIFSDLNKIENGNFYNFIVLNLGDLSKYPKETLNFVLSSLNLEIPIDFDYNIIKNDIDTLYVNEYNNLFGE